MLFAKATSSLAAAAASRNAASSTRIALASGSRRVAVAPRRAYSVAAAAAAPTPAAAVRPSSSDMPYIMASTLVFGSLFFYLTAPPAAKVHDHVAHAAAEVERQEATVDELLAVATTKIEPKDLEHDAPAGHHVLAAVSVEAHEEPAGRQKTTKEGPIASGVVHGDNTKFATAVGAAKEGHKDPSKISSNPKAVVMAARDEQSKSRAAKAAAGDDSVVEA